MEGIASGPIRPFRIEPFSSLEEYEACARFQEEVWGEGFKERVSPAILMVANRIGGLAAGAFDEEGRLMGFVFGLTGVEDGTLVHWSDMLAVRADLRDQGLGTILKAYQRSVLLERRVERMYWTFDPLQSRNAYVNFAKLGILSREYVPDMYGDTGSPLHRGIGTDRLVARWEMASVRVAGRLEGREVLPGVGQVEALPRVVPAEVRGAFPLPGDPVLKGWDGPVLVSIPRDIDGMMAESMELAVQWRQATRVAFLHGLSLGYEIAELIPDGPLSHYLLRPPESGLRLRP